MVDKYELQGNFKMWWKVERSLISANGALLCAESIWLKRSGATHAAMEFAGRRGRPA
jgi:hypothetical protein